MNENKSTNSSLDDWQKLSDFLKQNQQFTESQMRWLLLKREFNSLDKCTRKIGKCIYISTSGFNRWIWESEHYK